jgi:hypothetical protein
MFVIFTPLIRISPQSTSIEPQMMLSMDVLPLPLEPTTETNSPSLMDKLKSWKMQVSLIVPGL